MRHRRRIAITVLGIGVGALGITQAVSGEARRPAAPSTDSIRAVAQVPDATATTGDDADERVRRSESERAGRAAIDAVGGGRVSAVEREDEPGVAWEVEVVQPDGTEVEVDLDRDFGRVATDRDDEGAKDDDSAGADEVGEPRDDSDAD